MPLGYRTMRPARAAYPRSAVFRVFRDCCDQQLAPSFGIDGTRVVTGNVGELSRCAASSDPVLWEAAGDRGCHHWEIRVDARSQLANGARLICRYRCRARYMAREVLSRAWLADWMSRAAAPRAGPQRPGQGLTAGNWRPDGK